MYLKKIELHGFKSFADRVNLELQPGITGIVGPNGCGKSNITDAIRWVLGEQSVKSLRGTAMSDVIFAGSQDRKPQNLAEVTLVFDNSDRYIDSDYQNIEITRRIYRHNNEGEYLLNKQPCRLKDIVDLMMDTGLGRDSLSMISQGNISSFADSKPEERRPMFEEAAGVAKYKKRKIESLRRLEKTTENLNRVQDIVNELEKQIIPLKKQKEKAETYIALKKQLEEIEIGLIVHESTDLKAQIDQIKQRIQELENYQQSYSNDLVTKEALLAAKKDKMVLLDKEVDALQSKLMEALENVNRLNTSKVQIDEKRRHILENGSSENLEEQITSLKQMLSEVLSDYNQSVERYDYSKADLDAFESKRNQVMTKLNGLRQLLEQQNSKYNALKTKQSLIKEQIETNQHYNYGVKTILASSLDGVIDVLEKVITPQVGYEVAISTALGGAMQFVLTKDQASARQAIGYLKKNRAGRATFLPIPSLSKRSVRDEHLLVCQNTKGYLGIASEFVEYDQKYDKVISNQLGNTLIVEDLQTANHLANQLYYRYKIVTLNGDVVNVGGSMTGGQSRQQNSSYQSKKELEVIQKDLEGLEINLSKLKTQINEFDLEYREQSNELLQKKILFARLEEEVSDKLAHFKNIKAQYEAIAHEKVEVDSLLKEDTNQDLIQELNKANALKEELTASIKAKRETRMGYVNDNDILEQELRELRKALNDCQNQYMKQKVELTKLEGNLNSKLTYLNDEYKMTFEYASEHYGHKKYNEDDRSEVFALKTEIRRLGNVNLDAIEEYQNVSERFDHLTSQKEDLLEAQTTLLQAIDEMDEVMTKRFDETFNKVNEEFNLVFRSLLGGGKAMLKYSDPENILETGIDIDVQPPGKAVQNISLFSGGEKALIAISCLFAILKVRPVPMCILDEVEAALDQANVERFAKYLKEFEGKTQFIVVTHRPGTMEQCDILYGATMQQKGVTKLISVKFEEAAQNVS